jgi:Tfp pilus assembly protein PilN
MQFQIDMLRHTKGPQTYKQMVVSLSPRRVLEASLPVVVLLVLSLVVYIAGYMPRERPVERLEREVRQLTSELNGLRQTDGLMRQEIDTLSNLRRNTLLWVDILTAIGSTIPDDLWITKLETKTKRTREGQNADEDLPGIMIHGRSASAGMHLAALAKFMDRLGERPPIRGKFLIQDWSIKSPRVGEVVDFEIRLERKKSG